MNNNILIIEENPITSEFIFKVPEPIESDGYDVKKAIQIRKISDQISGITFGIFDKFDFSECPAILGTCKFYSFNKEDDQFILRVGLGHVLSMYRFFEYEIWRLPLENERFILGYLEGLVNLFVNKYSKQPPSYLKGTLAGVDLATSNKNKRLTPSYSNLNFNVKVGDFATSLSNIQIKIHQEELSDCSELWCSITNINVIPVYVLLTLSKVVCELIDIPLNHISYTKEKIIIFLGTKDSVKIDTLDSFSLRVLLEFGKEFHKYFYMQTIILKWDEEPEFFFNFPGD